ELQHADLGCDPHGLLTFRYRFEEKQSGKPVGLYHGFPLWEFSTTPRATLQRVFERLKTVPGVRSVAGMVYPPTVTNYPMPFVIEGRPAANTAERTADCFPITPNFFATMKIAM